MAAKIVDTNVIQMPEYSASNKPTKILVLELDIEIKSSTSKLEYSRARYLDITGTKTLDYWLIEIYKNNFSFNNITRYEPYYSYLSAKINELVYVVMKLKARNKIQFSRDGYLFGIPVSIESKDLFFEPRKVSPNGTTWPPSITTDECSVAYFIFDGVRAVDNYSNDLANGFPFNMMLDFISKQKDRGQSEDSWVPIIIDPDIRYPGGSAP